MLFEQEIELILAFHILTWIECNLCLHDEIIIKYITDSDDLINCSNYLKKYAYLESHRLELDSTEQLEADMTLLLDI